jgi:hypothetical protein
MKRRNRVLLMGMLTGIWLCVQSPFAHAQRMQVAAAAGEQPAQLVVEVEEAPCHDEHQPVPVDTASLPAAGIDTDSHAGGDGCCDGGHCDGQCAQFSWVLAAPTPQRFARGMAWLTPLKTAGLQRVQQPEPFRPPI